MPTIFGTNKNEGRIFVPAMPLIVPGTHFPPTPADTAASMRHFFSYWSSNTTVIANAAQSVLEEYPSSAYANEWYRASAVLTHYFFSCPTRRSAEAIASHGVPIYLYQFTYDLDWIEYGLLGDYHTSEIVSACSRVDAGTVGSPVLTLLLSVCRCNLQDCTTGGRAMTVVPLACSGYRAVVTDVLTHRVAPACV